MSRLWKLFTPEYLDEIEREAIKILDEAHEAIINPQAPDFIEGGTLGKMRRLAINMLLALGLLQKAPNAGDVFIITGSGIKLLDELKRTREEEARAGKRGCLFPQNDC